MASTRAHVSRVALLRKGLISSCAWRIVISPIIPQDSLPCYHSSMRHLVILFIHLIAILTQLLQPAGVSSLTVGLEPAFRRFRMDDSHEVAAECAGAQKGKGNLVSTIVLPPMFSENGTAVGV